MDDKCKDKDPTHWKLFYHSSKAVPLKNAPNTSPVGITSLPSSDQVIDLIFIH
jgi:hypothetical protein